jgi:hypothetical protein
MTNKEQVLYVLEHHNGLWFSHAQLAHRTGLRHQTIFQVCRDLANQGTIRREQGERGWWVCFGEPGRPLPEGGTHPISFDWISDEALRGTVRADWEEAIRALDSGIWKATVVMAGACLEGALIAALQKNEQNARKLISQKYSNFAMAGIPLRELARVGQRLGIIAPRASEFLVRSRNLIHPGNAASEATPPQRGDARAAVELLRDCLRKAVSS